MMMGNLDGIQPDIPMMKDSYDDKSTIPDDGLIQK
jgi:hypothetical protein